MDPTDVTTALSAQSTLIIGGAALAIAAALPLFATKRGAVWIKGLWSRMIG